MALTLSKIDDWAWHLHWLTQHNFVHCAFLLQPASPQPWHKSVVFPQGCHVFLLCLDSSHIVESVSLVSLFASWKCHQCAIKGKAADVCLQEKQNPGLWRFRESRAHQEFPNWRFGSVLYLGASELTSIFHFSHHSGKNLLTIWLIWDLDPLLSVSFLNFKLKTGTDLLDNFDQSNTWVSVPFHD